jgi:threonine/homoserine/homoserine lactone efflux protein
LAAAGVAAVVATSAELFTAVKLVGAILLMVMGALALRGRHTATGCLQAGVDGPTARRSGTGCSRA